MHRFPSDDFHRGGHHAALGWLHLLLFLGLIAALVLIAYALWRARPALGSGPVPPRATGGDAAVAELRLRYARGDIERDDYLRRAADLGDTTALLPPSPPSPPQAPPVPES
jgi:uncharacterized membrane protein